MEAVRYPKATWKGDGVSGGSYIGVPFRVVLHTTETQGLPSYNSGRSAPHLTYNPKTRKWTQHTSLGTSARALANMSGGVQTNRANSIQVEIICYSNKKISELVSNGLWVGNLSDDAYADLRAFLAWCADEFRINPTVWPGKQAHNYAQAAAAGFRMFATTWNKFNGVCGHQHVPENSHWDPGSINWDKLVKQSEGDGLVGWQWNDGVGAPILGVEDADTVFEFQGSFAPGVNQASYNPPTLDEANDRIWVVLARITEEIMKIRAGK